MKKILSPLPFTVLLICMVALNGKSALAVPKKVLCRPNICLPLNNKKVKKTQKSLPPGEYLVSGPKRAQVSNLPSVFPPEGTQDEPSAIKVPANKSITYRCTFVAGKLECYDVVSAGDCPTFIKVQDSATSSSYECDLDCRGGPDSNGECDCDILYNTCRQLT